MSHNAGQFIIANIAPHGLNTYPIKHLEAAQLEKILRDDAKDYFYSATVSTAGAYQGLNNAQYSWATVKLYYSSFYLLRGLLALSGICVFYDNFKPLTLKAAPAEIAKKPGGSRKNSTSHGVVISTAQSILKNAITAGQMIDSQDPLDWLKEKREDANYRLSRFCEPYAPDHFKMVLKHGVRNLIGKYIDDKTNLYVFDPDHAMIAYNLFLWQRMRDEMIRLSAFTLSNDDFIYLRSLFTDANGPMGPMQKLMAQPV